MKKKAISDYIGVDVSKDKLDIFWKKRKRYDIIENSKNNILKYIRGCCTTSLGKILCFFLQERLCNSLFLEPEGMIQKRTFIHHLVSPSLTERMQEKHQSAP